MKELSDEQWKEKLTPEQYRILREAGTEQAFTGAYWDETGKGTYRCAGCGEPLFASDDKYDAGCGWPSYTNPVDDEKIEKKLDFKLIVPRTEVRCKKCGGHLGHVFDDGPGPTGKRYCINSAALEFDKK